MVQTIQAGARATLNYPYIQLNTFPVTYLLNERETLYDTDGNPIGTPLGALSATVNSGMEYHLMGGVDYYFTDRWSIYVDARYAWAKSKVKVRIDGKTQILSSVKDYGCQDKAANCRTINYGDMDLSDSLLFNPTADDVQDLILIQGGDIRLGGFSLGVGAKVTF